MSSDRTDPGGTAPGGTDPMLDPILDVCLEEVLGGKQPPDLSARILAALESRTRCPASESSVGANPAALRPIPLTVAPARQGWVYEPAAPTKSARMAWLPLALAASVLLAASGYWLTRQANNLDKNHLDGAGALAAQNNGAQEKGVQEKGGQEKGTREPRHEQDPVARVDAASRRVAADQADAASRRVAESGETRQPTLASVPGAPAGEPCCIPATSGPTVERRPARAVCTRDGTVGPPTRRCQ